MGREMTATTPRWTRLEHTERREQILACARRLFSERHYSAVSTADIAREAGVVRGLLHHYFGSKRELYLEVVRGMVRVPPPPLPEELEGRPVEEVVADSVDRWLEMVRRNRGTWLAAIGAEGFGRDPDIERVLEEAREAAAARLTRVLGMDGDAPSELRAVIRAYAGLAEGATREWLQRGRLSREQVHVLLTDTLLALAREVLPRVVAAGRDGKPTKGRRR
jgi:AcrR family transcriptional regulator